SSSSAEVTSITARSRNSWSYLRGAVKTTVSLARSAPSRRPRAVQHPGHATHPAATRRRYGPAPDRWIPHRLVRPAAPRYRDPRPIRRPCHTRCRSRDEPDQDSADEQGHHHEQTDVHARFAERFGQVV